MFHAVRYWVLRLRVEHARASCEAQLRLLAQSHSDLEHAEAHLRAVTHELALAETAFLIRERR